MNRLRMLATPFLLTLCVSQLLISTSCSSKEKMLTTSDWLTQVRSTVISEVKDTGRAAKILAELEDVDLKLHEWERYLVQYYAELKTLNANYDATPDEFHAFLAGYNSRRHQMKEDLLGARFRIKELTTEKEWKELAALEKTLFQQWWSDSSGWTYSVNIFNGEDT